MCGAVFCSCFGIDRISYEVVDKNLNENADSVCDKARAVYI